jgi:hypothetical protein
VKPAGALRFVWSQYDFADPTEGVAVDYDFNGAGTDFFDRRTFYAIAPTLFDQLDGFINGWDVADMNDGRFSGVVYATAPLTTVHFSIEADRLVPVLRFPLRGSAPGLDAELTANSATISAVFDHSMANRAGRFTPYGHDRTVTAFTGAVTHRRHDGNPGVDYPAALGTEVYAAASGTIHYPARLAGIRSGARAYKRYHVLELIPDAAPNYRVYYLYLSTHPATGRTVSRQDTTDGCPSPLTLPLAEGSHVEAGCLLALSGKAGGTGTLHFEVREVVPLEDLPSAVGDAVRCPDDATAACVPLDPYGWEGDGPDPFESLTGCANTRLWE